MAENDYDLFAKMGLLGGDEFDRGLSSLLTSSGVFEAKWLAVGGAVAAVGTAIIACTTEAAAFEDAMKNVETVVGKGNDSFISQMSDDLLAMSRQMPFTGKELAGTLYDIVSYGVPAADAMNVLRVSSEAAVGGFTEVNNTFGLFASIIKGYGLSWDDIADVSDKMFLVASQGATTIEQLSSSIGSTIPFAKALGVELDEVYAVMSTLPGVTGTTSEAATQLTSAFTALLDPSEKMKKAYAELGVASGQELIDKMGGLQGALMALKKYTDEHNMAIGELLGRKEAQLAFFQLTGEQAREYADKLLGMSDSMGKAAEAYDIKMQSTTNQWNLLVSSFKSYMVDIGDFVLPIANNMIQLLNNILDFDLGGIVKSAGELIDSVMSKLWVYDKIKEFYSFVIDEIAGSDFVQSLLSDMREALGAFAEGLAGFFGINEISKLADDVADFFGGIIDDVKSLFSDPLTIEQRQLLNAMEQNTKDMFQDIKDADKNRADELKKNAEKVEAAAAAQKKYNDEMQKYLDGIAKDAHQSLLDINSELYKQNGYWNDITYFMGDESNSASTMLDTMVDSTQAMEGSIRGYRDVTKELANNLIPEATRNTDLEKAAAKELKEHSEKNREAWSKVVDYSGALLQLMPGLNSESRQLLNSFSGIATSLASGDYIGAALKTATSAITYFKNQADAANKQELKTFQAYAAEYYDLQSQLDKIVGIDKTRINQLIQNYEDLEQAGTHNREQLIPILRDTIREISSVAEAEIKKLEESTGQIYKQTAAVGELEIAWESMLKTTLGLWENWEKDSKTIFAGLEKLLYFKLDVDTTEADEQIADAIKRMMDYADTLNKTSDAYSDIQASITEMMIQYAATGASANEAATALATAILNVRDLIQEATDADQRKALQSQLDAMISQFKNLNDVLNVPKVIKVDTSGAVDALDDLNTKVPKYSGEAGAEMMEKLHGGGFPFKAHSGYLAPEEIDVRIRKDEIVLRPEITEAFGAGPLMNFNRTGNPAYLGAGSQKINVSVFNATPQTYIKITDDVVAGRIDYRDRKLKVGANPYA